MSNLSSTSTLMSSTSTLRSSTYTLMSRTCTLMSSTYRKCAIFNTLMFLLLVFHLFILSFDLMVQYMDLRLTLKGPPLLAVNKANRHTTKHTMSSKSKFCRDLSIVWIHLPSGASFGMLHETFEKLLQFWSKWQKQILEQLCWNKALRLAIPNPWPIRVLSLCYSKIC